MVCCFILYFSVIFMLKLCIKKIIKKLQITTKMFLRKPQYFFPFLVLGLKSTNTLKSVSMTTTCQINTVSKLSLTRYTLNEFI